VAELAASHLLRLVPTVSVAMGIAYPPGRCQGVARTVRMALLAGKSEIACQLWALPDREL
jgi:hypothetical protein